jgi:5'(3')-deoxyribonucleotidase
MRHFIIGIDLDDVLADFMPAYLALAYKRFGRPPLGSMPIDWEWSNILPSKEDQELVWQDVKAIPNFWERLDIVPGVTRWRVHELDRDHKVYFPTARVEVHGPASAAKQSAAWIHAKFGIQYPAVFAAYEKKPMALALKYDYFIDDRPKNCLDIKDALPNCKVYLKDSSHNKPFQILHHPSIEGVVRDFNEFAQIVKDASREE